MSRWQGKQSGWKHTTFEIRLVFTHSGACDQCTREMAAAYSGGERRVRITDVDESMWAVVCSRSREC